MKQCTKCNTEKERDRFSKDRSAKDGLFFWCKLCVKEKYQNDNKERIKNHREKLDSRKARTEKECSKCFSVKPLSDFTPKRTVLDGRSSVCHQCTNRITKERYEISRKSKREKLKLYYINKLGGKCSSCGISPSADWPLACFDFHHLTSKDSHISRLINSMSKDRDRVLEEVSKCVILCSNCHRKEHYMTHITRVE